MWVRLDDRLPDNPKIVGLSNSAFRLYVHALCHAAAQLTDGLIQRNALPRLAWASETPAADAAELVAAGLWEPTPAGWMIHDYLQYNPTRAQALATRATRAAAGAAGGRAGTGASKRRSQSQARANPVPVPVPVPQSTDGADTDSPQQPDLTSAAGIWAHVTGLIPSPTALAAMAHVADLDLWAEIIQTWLLRGYNPANLAGPMDWYTRGAIPKANGAAARPPSPADYAAGATPNHDHTPASIAASALAARWHEAEQQLRTHGLSGFFHGAEPRSLDGQVLTLSRTPHIAGMLAHDSAHIRQRAEAAIAKARTLDIVLEQIP